MRNPVRKAKVFLVAVVVAGISLTDQIAAEERDAIQPAPQRALGINETEGAGVYPVTRFGLRVRVSDRLFDMAKLAALPMISKFSEPASVGRSTFYSNSGGFNTVLDPGYDMTTHAAGGVRTTPVQFLWSWRDDTGCTGAGVPAGSAECLDINTFGTANSAAQVAKRFHWLPTQRPGLDCSKDLRAVVNIDACDANPSANATGDGWQVSTGILCNQRGVPPYWRTTHAAHGFFVNADGSCYVVQNVCMSNAGTTERWTGTDPDARDPGGWAFEDVSTAYQAAELGTVCDTPAQWTGAGAAREAYLNVGVFLFPNAFVENAAGGGAAYQAWQKPRTLHLNADGDYFGYVPSNRYGSYTGRGGVVGTNAPTRHQLRLTGIVDANGNPAGAGNRWVSSGFPSNGNYDERNPYDEYFGSYFRAGDDIAFYADVKQMQIHSIDRDTQSKNRYGDTAVAGCGFAPVYTGTLDGNGEPNYFMARVPQCLRPKSYWHGPPNLSVNAKMKWVACDPYDTYLPDGSLNPSRDDDREIYPGPAYPALPPDQTQTAIANTCGTQSSANKLLPFEAGGAGTGWSALRLDNLALDTANNKIDFAVSGDEWRLETAIMFDFGTECWVQVSGTAPVCAGMPGYQVRRRWAMGSLMIDSLIMSGSAKIVSVDDKSCGTTGGGCGPDDPNDDNPWGPADDGLVRPDRLNIGLNIDTLQFNFHQDPTNWRTNDDTQPHMGITRNMYRAIYSDLGNQGYTCFTKVYGSSCTFALARVRASEVEYCVFGNCTPRPTLMMSEISNTLAGEFTTQFEDLIRGMVRDLNASLPNLSGALGDPWNFGNSLIDAGIFIVGSEDGYAPDAVDPTRRVWELNLQQGDSTDRNVISINGALGFRPIAFEMPPDAEGYVKVDDPSDGIAPTSVFAVPRLVYPETSDCQVSASGSGFSSAVDAAGAANTWVHAGATAYAYEPAPYQGKGWITGVGTTTSNSFGQAFFDRVTWKWARVLDLHKLQSGTSTGSGEWGMYPSNAYRVETGRAADLPNSNTWGVSRGWLKATMTDAEFTKLRVGDHFYVNNNPNVRYPIKALGTLAQKTIQLDFEAAYAHRGIPLRLDGTNPQQAFTVTSRRCSRTESLYPAPIPDNAYDYGDFLLEQFNFVDPKTNKSYGAYTSKRVIPPYYKMWATSPTTQAWCNSPVKAKEDRAKFETYYPMKTWLSFGAVDGPPPGFDNSQAIPGSHTVGGWTSIKPNYLGAINEQVAMSDVQILAAAPDESAKGGWVMTTTNVNTANQGNALRSGNLPSDTLRTAVITNSGLAQNYALWVAHSKVEVPAVVNPAKSQWVWSDKAIWNASSSRGTWTQRSDGAVSNSNMSGGAGVMDGVNNSTLRLTVNPGLSSGTYRFWVAATSIRVATCGGYLQTGCANLTLNVLVDGVSVGTRTLNSDNNWSWTQLANTRVLAAGNHTIDFVCTASNTTRRCGVDGFMLTTETTDPRTDPLFNSPSYQEADWDNPSLDFWNEYDDGVRTQVNSTLAVKVDGNLLSSFTQTARNNFVWRNFGTVSLAAGTHFIEFQCTLPNADNNDRCAVDGLVLTSLGTNPASAGGFTPYLTANWDNPALDIIQIPPGTPARGIVEADQNDYGVKESSPKEYDVSLHLHQRTLNELAHAVITSGSGCLEFQQTDPNTGEKTPWADFMNTSRFAAFIPELSSLYKNAPVKLRIAPQRTPRIRTGIGTLNWAAGARTVGSAPIVDEPYTLAAAIPDLSISVAIVDPETQAEIPMFEMYYSTVVGLYMRAMRTCHQLDRACSLTKDAGYWQLYLDYGNPNLSAEFEPPLNTLDEFMQGRFSRSEFVCDDTGCATVVAPGTAQFEVKTANCGTKCDRMGFAQSIATLLDSVFSLYVDTRATTDFFFDRPAGQPGPLPLDILYLGPDGPNDDGVGGASVVGSRGDYLGVYLALKKQELDLESLMAGLDLAPKVFVPQAVIPSLEATRFVNNNRPLFDLAFRGASGTLEPGSLFTYRLNGGFWRTPRAATSLELGLLTEGAHRLELKSVVSHVDGFVNQGSPTVFEFTVDTLAPEVSILPSSQGVYSREARISITDLQTKRDEIFAEYSLDGGDWRELDGERVSLRSLADGRHTLRVRATDLAGNTGEAARELVVRDSGGCGGCASSGDDTFLALLALAALLSLRRRFCRQGAI